MCLDVPGDLPGGADCALTVMQVEDYGVIVSSVTISKCNGAFDGLKAAVAFQHPHVVHKLVTISLFVAALPWFRFRNDSTSWKSATAPRRSLLYCHFHSPTRAAFLFPLELGKT